MAGATVGRVAGVQGLQWWQGALVAQQPSQDHCQIPNVLDL